MLATISESYTVTTCSLFAVMFRSLCGIHALWGGLGGRGFGWAGLGWGNREGGKVSTKPADTNTSRRCLHEGPEVDTPTLLSSRNNKSGSYNSMNQQV